jgi:hypothetical protein
MSAMIGDLPFSIFLSIYGPFLKNRGYKVDGRIGMNDLLRLT